jgi:hypothetical protein
LRLIACALFAASLLCCASANAADEKLDAAQMQMFEGGTNTLLNWIELSAGGLMTSGDKAQAAQRQQINPGAFGGIEDLHFQEDIDKLTQFTLDGHSIFDQHDYNFTLGIRRQKLGYLKFNFENFRTWYDSTGGFFPADGTHYSLQNDPLYLDQGQFSIEAGLTPENAPQITFKYTHTYRDGDKSSTIWGPVQVTTGPPGFTPVTRSLYPGFYDINEKADIFQLDITHRIKTVDVGVGVRYETGSLDDALKTYSRPDDPTQSQKITDRQGTSYDMLSVHAFSETWLNKGMFLSAGFLFANLDDTFSGQRTYGDDFDVNYMPNTLAGLGYYGLNGGAHKQEYTANLNLLTIPSAQLTIVPSLRVNYENWDADSSGMGTLGDFAPEPFTDSSHRNFLDVRERVDIRYTGFTNWVLYAGPEWTEGQGSLQEHGGLSQVNGIGVAPIERDTDDSRFLQKYFAGARWYPTRKLTVDVSGYYKKNSYDYTHEVDSTPNNLSTADAYPAFLVMQGFETYDGSLRLSFKPVRNVSLVTSYEYQYSTIQTEPDPVSGLGSLESSRMISHIIGQNIGWTPWSRLSLQLGFNYVLSETKTPASSYTQAVLDSQNNYWTLNFSAGVVLDDKTDLNLGYYYYQSADFQDNSNFGLPLGAAVEEHGVTVGLTRRINKNLRLNVRYGYTHYDDAASGGFNNYQAHLVSSSLQYRF